jgi:hypothetical protein
MWVLRCSETGVSFTRQPLNLQGHRSRRRRRSQEQLRDGLQNGTTKTHRHWESQKNTPRTLAFSSPNFHSKAKCGCGDTTPEAPASRENIEHRRVRGKDGMEHGIARPSSCKTGHEITEPSTIISRRSGQGREPTFPSSPPAHPKYPRYALIEKQPRGDGHTRQPQHHAHGHGHGHSAHSIKH